MPKKSKIGFKFRKCRPIKLTIDDEVCIPSLFSILLAVLAKGIFTIQFPNVTEHNLLIGKTNVDKKLSGTEKLFVMSNFLITFLLIWMILRSGQA